MNRFLKRFALFLAIIPLSLQAQEPSIAMQWNEVLLDAIRNDFARPTVHARNLWHSSVLMYDAWAVYDEQASTYFLGNEVGGFAVPFNGVPMPDDVQAAREEVISYAMYRLMQHRFQFSPGADLIMEEIDQTMTDLGYDLVYASTDYENGPPAALGNYLAEMMIEFGLQDGSNENSDYTNQYYLPVNEPLDMTGPGNPNIDDPNRWQPLEVPEFIDQGGNPFTDTPPFLSPEWGNVVAFALDDSVKTTYERDGNEYHVYHDPGPPPYIDTLGTRENDEFYRWGFSMVAVWQSHHKPGDGVMWDISPASIGNVQSLPQSYDEYDEFYDFFNGGDPGEGHDINPATGEPYEPQLVARADYTRILAEFWADGPDSETPPGHWFTIVNYVNSHPDLEKRWRGEGPILDDLEWDVKSYFTLGGAMHDAAVSAWGVKGWYDFIRPVSAIRFMCDKGQNTDPDLPSFHEGGIPLIDGLIELVEEGDPLAGLDNINVGKIKLYTWRGPDYIPDPETDYAGVGWILAENWWPYQRPTFVTPPFAGFVSGHSTYSRAAAEVLTAMTGDPFFPGGMGEFHCAENEFLVFEEGPTMDVTLQWATYRDASDQCSLSRIWGGIHPPCDDIPGRLMGIKIGNNAFTHANEFIEAGLPRVESVLVSTSNINSLMDGNELTLTITFDQEMNSAVTPSISFSHPEADEVLDLINTNWTDMFTVEMTYLITVADLDPGLIDLTVAEAENTEALTSVPHNELEALNIDMVIPNLNNSAGSEVLLNEAFVGNELHLDFTFSEAMNDASLLTIAFDNPDVTACFASAEAEWVTPTTWRAYFELGDNDLELNGVSLSVEGATDEAGNPMIITEDELAIEIDTKAPAMSLLLPSVNPLTEQEVGGEGFALLFVFDEAIDESNELTYTLAGGQINQTLSLIEEGWQNPYNYLAVFDVNLIDPMTNSVDVNMTGITDLAGNSFVFSTIEDAFIVDFTLINVEENNLSTTNIFPVPAIVGQDLVIEFRVSENITYTMYNTQGQLVKQGNNNSRRLIISTAQLAAGEYIIHLDNGTQQVHKRVQLLRN